MPKRGGNISLTSYDDIFETDESRAESQLERVQNICKFRPNGVRISFRTV